MSFGSTLARLRRSRGWSQEALAHRAGVSQRHLSFLETGRSLPGQRSLRSLIAALALRGWEQRSLLEALAPSASPVPTESPNPAMIAQLTERLTPWPAYAFRPDGTLICANLAMNALLAWAAPGKNLWQLTAPPGGPNIYDLALHPDGLLRWMENPHEVVPEMMRRLRIEAAMDPTLAPMVQRLEAFPSVRAISPTTAAPPPLLVERYRLGRQILAVIAMVSHLASPGEIELGLLRIESFVPADEESERILIRQ
jgi:transcriptional regulator with XRE-family HTH domain